MSMKIHVSYSEDSEADLILELLKPLIPFYKVKKCTNKVPYNHLYFTPKNSGNARH